MEVAGGHNARPLPLYHNPASSQIRRFLDPNDSRRRVRAIAIGEKIGLYKDWPMSKGCVIPYAASAIPEMVKRQGG